MELFSFYMHIKLTFLFEESMALGFFWDYDGQQKLSPIRRVKVLRVQLYPVIDPFWD